MAEAEKKFKIETVERVIQENKKVPDGIILTLTQEEAVCLRDILGRIAGGSGKDGPTRHRVTVNSVWEAVAQHAESLDCGDLFVHQPRLVDED